MVFRQAHAGAAVVYIVHEQRQFPVLHVKVGKVSGGGSNSIPRMSGKGIIFFGPSVDFHEQREQPESGRQANDHLDQFCQVSPNLKSWTYLNLFSANKKREQSPLPNRYRPKEGRTGYFHTPLGPRRFAILQGFWVSGSGGFAEAWLGFFSTFVLVLRHICIYLTRIGCPPLFREPFGGGVEGTPKGTTHLVFF